MLRLHVIPVLGLLLPAIMAADAPPTDTELLAGYCVGVLTTTRDMARHAGELTTPGPVGDVMRKLGGERDQRITRLNDYLIAKGAYDANRDSFGVFLAMKHGTEDVQRCSAEQTQESRQCVAKCFPSPTDKEAVQCVEKCPQPDSCFRVRRCNSADNALPF